MKKIGLTTTVPIEIIYAAGLVPVDVNNIFITHGNPVGLVEEAEVAGYPRNLCGWIKGIYSAVLGNDEIDTLIAVTQGDCSNTHALMETLQLKGIKTIPFAFPFDRDKEILALQIEKLMDIWGVTWDQVYEQKKRLDGVRSLIWQLDELTWKDNLVTGFENHLYQVSCSDFNGDPEVFAQEAEAFLEEVKKREPKKDKIRLGYIGVPPIMPNLYDYVENQGARVVFNEVQRQFTMPFDTDDIVEQYQLYTYPYDIFARIGDIEKEVERRNLDALIHYTQSFCFRQIEDIIIREKIDIPILTLEGDNPTQLDARSRMRVDSFIDMLK